jgi:hypothetical protein
MPKRDPHSLHDPQHAYFCAVPWCPKYVRAAELHQRMGHEPGALPDCSPLLCGHPANPEPSDAP